MNEIEVSEAQVCFTNLVEAIEKGDFSEIIMTRNGHPVARLMSCKEVLSQPKIGIAKGAFEVPDPDEGTDREIVDLFYEGKD